jgi:hypothetical protein
MRESIYSVRAGFRVDVGVELCVEFVHVNVIEKIGQQTMIQLIDRMPGQVIPISHQSGKLFALDEKTLSPLVLSR